MFGVPWDRTCLSGLMHRPEVVTYQARDSQGRAPRSTSRTIPGALDPPRRHNVEAVRHTPVAAT
jgi:hypothetical protein